MKKCSVCLEVKEESLFRKNALSEDGLRSECSSCSVVWYSDKKYGEQKSETINKLRIKKLEMLKSGKKLCSCCRLWLNFSEFYKSSKNTWCKTCISISKKGTRDSLAYKHKVKMSKDRFRKNPLIQMLSGAKTRAKNKGLDFNLTKKYIEDLWEEQNGICSISKIPFDLNVYEEFSRSPFRPSLDRIVRSKGYVIGNVRIILNALNTAINEYELSVFVKIARAVLENIDEDAVSEKVETPPSSCKLLA